MTFSSEHQNSSRTSKVRTRHFVGIYFAVVAASCSNDGERYYGITQSRQIVGQVESASVPFTELQARLIDAGSNRRDVIAAVDASGAFTFDFVTSNLFDTEKPEGNSYFALPPLSIDRSFFQQSKYALRMELVQKSSGAASETRSYGQYIVGIPSYFFLNNVDYNLPSLSLSQAQFVVVKATDDFGQAIPAARVSAFAAGVYDNQGVEAKVREREPYRPMISTTGTDGSAVAGPLLPPSSGRDYRVYASADGYCTRVTEVKQLPDTLEAPIEIRLSKCDPIDGFEVIFTESEKLQTESVNGTSQNILYTNIRNAGIAIKTTGDTLPGVKIQVFEDWNTNANIYGDTTYDDYQSEINVEIPIIFKASGNANGRFAIQVTNLANPSATTMIYGKKNTTVPENTFMDTLVVTSAAGQQNILSGNSGVSFTVSSDDCVTGAKLGIKTAFMTNQIFSKCTDGVATFDPKDIVFSSNPASPTGGNSSIRFYFANLFGTENVDITDDTVRDIFVDFGTPALDGSNLSLGFQFGVVQTGVSSGAGKNDDPYVFDTSSPVRVKRADLSPFALAFSSPQDCKLASGTAADGASTGTSGYEIAKFGVTASSQSNCQQDGTTISLPLSQAQITFPADMSQPATFNLLVTDKAGHTSATRQFSLPACSALTASDAACWE